MLKPFPKGQAVGNYKNDIVNCTLLKTDANNVLTL